MRFTCFTAAVLTFVLSSHKADAISLTSVAQNGTWNDVFLAQESALRSDQETLALAQTGVMLHAHAHAPKKTVAAEAAPAKAESVAAGAKAAFNASSLTIHGEESLKALDSSEINCTLKKSQLKGDDSHDVLKAKHNNIKMLANKLKQKADGNKKDMEANKETEAELRRLLKEQSKTLAESEVLEAKREKEEQKDLNEALKVRMREVEKLERVRLESQMKCERERAAREMDQMKAHFEAEDAKKDAEGAAAKKAAALDKKAEESECGIEAAKQALSKAQADMAKYTGIVAGSLPAPAASSQTEVHVVAEDAELAAKKKEADVLIAKLKEANRAQEETAVKDAKAKKDRDIDDAKSSEKKKVKEVEAEKEVVKAKEETKEAKKVIEKAAESTTAAAKPAGDKPAGDKPAGDSAAAKKADDLTDKLEIEIKKSIDKPAADLARSLATILGEQVTQVKAKDINLDQKLAKMVIAAKAAKKDGKAIRESAEFKKASQVVEDTLEAFFNNK